MGYILGIESTCDRRVALPKLRRIKNYSARNYKYHQIHKEVYQFFNISVLNLLSSLLLEHSPNYPKNFLTTLSCRRFV